jgi:SHS family lactate transporter-like MFS transporter
MATTVESARIPWWKEPTKDQWFAWVASWLGWTLDAFDFTVFLLIMVPIAKEFDVPLTDVAIVFTITLWMRLVGAVSSGWLADRVGRRLPLMLSILGYSFSNFIAGFSPTFWFLLLFRALLGLFMGAEWPAGAALAMETWPKRSRGFMSGVMQGSWGIGFFLSSGIYALFYDYIGWRGMLWIGVLPALSVFFVRFFVKEPEVWVENRRLQQATQRVVKAPLTRIFKAAMLGNTLNACWFMASGFVTYYCINALFATHLQKDLGLSPALVATPIMLANIVVFFSAGLWGWVADRFGRRMSLILPGLITIPFAFLYLLTSDFTLIVIGFVLQGIGGGGGFGGPVPAYLNERFPTEIRATATAFTYHQGAIWGGFVAPVITWIATNYGIGFAYPMLIGTCLAAGSFVLAIVFGPETKDVEMVPDLVVA